MSWIELHDTLPDHKKVLAVADALKMDKDTVVGKLVRLWTWAINNREDGAFKACDVPTIAEVMRVKGKPQRLVDVMVAARLLDCTGDKYVIHDWDEHVAMLMAKRETVRAQTRARVKRYRTQKSDTCNALHERYVTPECNASNAVTIPYHTNNYYDNDNRAREGPEYNPDIARVARAYQSSIRIPTAIEAQELAKWLDTFTADIILYAIEQAALSGARTYRTIETILLRWQDIGVKDLPAAQAAQREWQNRRQKHDGTGNVSANEEPPKKYGIVV